MTTNQSINEQNKTWLFSRHQGCIDWIKSQSIAIDYTASHMTGDENFSPGDVVIGSLPVSKIAELSRKGVRFISVDLTISEEQRGKELCRNELDMLDVRLSEYLVLEVDSFNNNSSNNDSFNTSSS